MRVVIIEDEFFSAEKLKRQLLNIDSTLQILAVLHSVEESLVWFKTHEEPDLIFSDIHLEDQSSFELFRQHTILAPVIYTTAYDQYALQAFKQNGIDYLLKPIDIEDLKVAIRKYENLEYRSQKRNQNFKSGSQSYKERFLVKNGSLWVVVKTVDIAYFKSDQKINFLVTFDKHKYVVEQTLDQIAEQLDSRRFNRINRGRLIALESIKKIHSHLNGRLKLELSPPDEEEVFVSRERVAAFKNWLDA